MHASRGESSLVVVADGLVIDGRGHPRAAAAGSEDQGRGEGEGERGAREGSVRDAQIGWARARASSVTSRGRRGIARWGGARARPHPTSRDQGRSRAQRRPIATWEYVGA